jgi:hypothetical protein
MLGAVVEANAETDSYVPEVPTDLPEKEFSLVWDTKSKSKYSEELQEHIDGFIEESFKSMPAPVQACHADPRAYLNGAQWRDEVRHQLALQELHVNFASINIEYESVRQNIFGRNNAIPWPDVLTILNTVDTPISFVYVLRAGYDGDQWVPEYVGPPLALSKDMNVSPYGEFSAVITPTKLTIPDRTRTTTAILMPAALVPKDLTDPKATSAEETTQRAFLSGATTSSAEYMPDPVKDWPNKRLRDLHHSKIDMTTEKGVHEWRMKALNDSRICPL